MKWLSFQFPSMPLIEYSCFISNHARMRQNSFLDDGLQWVYLHNINLYKGSWNIIKLLININKSENILYLFTDIQIEKQIFSDFVIRKVIWLKHIQLSHFLSRLLMKGGISIMIAKYLTSYGTRVFVPGRSVWPDFGYVSNSRCNHHLLLLLVHFITDIRI